MHREAFVLTIRPEKISEYVDAHTRVWPEILDLHTKAGIRNYTIFLHENQAFGYFECDDVQESYAILATDPVAAKWEDWMEEMLEERVPLEGPPSLPEIFRLD